MNPHTLLRKSQNCSLAVTPDIGQGLWNYMRDPVQTAHFIVKTYYHRIQERYRFFNL